MRRSEAWHAWRRTTRLYQCAARFSSQLCKNIISQLHTIHTIRQGSLCVEQGSLCVVLSSMHAFVPTFPVRPHTALWRRRLRGVLIAGFGPRLSTPAVHAFLNPAHQPICRTLLGRGCIPHRLSCSLTWSTSCALASTLHMQAQFMLESGLSACVGCRSWENMAAGQL